MTDPAPIHDPGALTHHIETRYHAAHRRQAPHLLKLAEMVEDLHEGDAGAPVGLAVVLRRMIGDMEVHMKKEELILFPALRRGGGPGVAAPIAALRADHADRDRDLAELQRLTGGLTLPNGACTAWATLYDGLGGFIADLTEHIRLENDVLFPPFEHGAAARP